MSPYASPLSAVSWEGDSLYGCQPASHAGHEKTDTMGPAQSREAPSPPVERLVQISRPAQTTSQSEAEGQPGDHTGVEVAG